MKQGVKWTLLSMGVILIVLFLRNCVITSYLIPSSGMENSLYQGERILVNRWSYGLRLPFMSLWGYHRWADKPVAKEDIIVFNNPGNIQNIVTDQKETFIGRCIGIPGDTLWVDSLFTILSSEKNSPDDKSLYAYPKQLEVQLDSLLTSLSIKGNEVIGEDSIKKIRSFSRYEYYLLEQAINGSCWIKAFNSNDSIKKYPLIIPRKGKPIQVYPWNCMLLRNTLVLHEKKQAEVKNDTLYIEGKPVQNCYFTKDYYWVVTNNSINLSDSHIFGFVPKDYIIGKASFIWFSKSNTGLFKGYRWERLFKTIK